jgi:hypothetical protein
MVEYIPHDPGNLAEHHECGDWRLLTASQWHCGICGASPNLSKPATPPADSHVETSDGAGWDRDTIQRIINGGGTSWSDAEHIDALLADRDRLARENAAMRRDRQRDTNADRFRAKVIGDLEAERDQLLADRDRLTRIEQARREAQVSAEAELERLRGDLEVSDDKR